MAGKSKKIVKIKLVSTGTTAKGTKTGTFYTTTKNPKNIAEKLHDRIKSRIKKDHGYRKYDPRAYNPATGKNGMHVDFEEAKIK